MPTNRHYSFAERLERFGIVILAILVLYLAFVGLLSITRGTPVQTVIAEGDRSGPPAPTDSLFARTMEMYTGTHIQPGTLVDVVVVITPEDQLSGKGPISKIVLQNIKVLANGQPLATTVNATYDDFSKQQDTYAYATQSKADGTAVVKITQAGLWMVRVQNSVQEVTDLYDRHVTRAVVVFSIK